MNQRVIRSDRPIYQLLEKHIKASEHPITCVKLMEIDEIREEALREFGGEDRDIKRATYQVSNNLGLMWRKSVLIRTPAMDKTRAQWAYTWNTSISDKPRPILAPKPITTPTKSVVNIEEIDGEVVIEFEHFIIKIKQK